MVRVVLERSTELEAELLSPARTLARRIARTAESGAGGPPGRRTTSLLRTVPVRLAVEPPAAESTGERNGSGASRAMGLANKLTKLIHLSREERRASDAQRQVRMSEQGAGAETRADTGAGRAGGESEEERALNIKALRQDLVEAVLRQLESTRWRREDPDGPAIWC